MTESKVADQKPSDQYHHGDLRNAILKTSLTIVEELGVDALTLRSVSKRLSVSHAAPVYHFRTRVLLLAAIAEEGFRLLADSLEDAGKTKDQGRLLRVVQAYLDFAQSHPNHYRVMFGPESAAFNQANATFAFQGDRAFAVLAETSGEAGVPLGERSLAVWSLVHGLVMLYQGPLACRITPETASWMQGLKDGVAARVVQILEAE